MTARRIELFDDRLMEQRMRLDRMFSTLMLVQWVAAIVVAAIYSPIAWARALISMLMVRLSPGSAGSRRTIAVCQMLFSSLFIYLSGGRVETHFHIFVSLAWLGFYLDGRILVTAVVMMLTTYLIGALLAP